MTSPFRRVGHFLERSPFGPDSFFSEAVSVTSMTKHSCFPLTEYSSSIFILNPGYTTKQLTVPCESHPRGWDLPPVFQKWLYFSKHLIFISVLKDHSLGVTVLIPGQWGALSSLTRHLYLLQWPYPGFVIRKSEKRPDEVTAQSQWLFDSFLLQYMSSLPVVLLTHVAIIVQKEN